MKNKLDLNQYLVKYGEKSGRQMNFHPSNSRAKRFHQGYYGAETYTSNTIDYEGFNPQQTRYTGFTKSQTECIQQLQQIKRSLVNEERELSFFLENYSKKLYDNLLIEHNRIRQQILDLFDRIFSQSQKRISEIVSRGNGSEPVEFGSIRKRISQINRKVDGLDAMLRSENYRKAIAEVVTLDFQSEVRNLQTSITNAQKSVMDNAIQLIVDQNALNKLKESIHSLIITNGPRHNMHMTSNNQPTNSVQERKSSKGRIGLFDTAPQFKDSAMNSGRGFFNFGN